MTVAPDRLRPLVIGRVRPKDRPEEELAGYRRALDWIFLRKRPVAITPAVIRKLHALAQGGSSGDAGEWKSRDNEIIEILPNGERHVRFAPASARDTPKMMEALCRNYAQITTLLLQSHAFDVSRYVSLERMVEERREEYYRVLAECSLRWHEGKNEILPWWNFWLSVIRAAYKEFEFRMESTDAHPARSDLVRHTILAQVEEFALGDLTPQLPAVSSQLVRKVLSQMKKTGEIELTGKGRGARWQIRSRR